MTSPTKPPEATQVKGGFFVYSGRRKRGKSHQVRKPLDPETWARIETLAYCQCPLSEISSVLNINPDRLGNQIRTAYHLEPEEFLKKYADAGKAKFRANLFNKASSCENPILSIFCAKNWLGMIDEKTVKKPDDPNNNKNLLEFMGILKSIATKPANTPIITTRETIAVITDTPTILPVDIPTNLIPLPITIPNNNNKLDQQPLE
jgi:hypothetical protein